MGGTGISDKWPRVRRNALSSPSLAGKNRCSLSVTVKLLTTAFLVLTSKLPIPTEDSPVRPSPLERKWKEGFVS